MSVLITPDFLQMREHLKTTSYIAQIKQIKKQLVVHTKTADHTTHSAIFYILLCSGQSFRKADWAQNTDQLTR